MIVIYHDDLKEFWTANTEEDATAKALEIIEEYGPWTASVVEYEQKQDFDDEVADLKESGHIWRGWFEKQSNSKHD